MFIKSSKKKKEGGKVRYFVGNRPIKGQNNSGEQFFYPIHIYEQDSEPKKKFIPRIEYPHHRSPIISFNPNISTTMQGLFLTTDGYRTFNPKTGLKEEENIAIKAIDAKYAASSKLEGITNPVDEAVEKSDAEVKNEELHRPIWAEIELEMLGDPIFSNVELHTGEVQISMSDIEQNHMFIDNKDLFANFKQLPTTSSLLATDGPPDPSISSVFSKRGLFPLLPGIPASGVSPFNGFWKIWHIRQTIDPSRGFVTYLKLINPRETLGGVSANK